jgi:hypothetical protein
VPAAYCGVNISRWGEVTWNFCSRKENNFIRNYIFPQTAQDSSKQHENSPNIKLYIYEMIEHITMHHIHREIRGDNPLLPSHWAPKSVFKYDAQHIGNGILGTPTFRKFLNRCREALRVCNLRSRSHYLST